MKGLICYGPRDIRYEDLEDPEISDPDDVLVKMTQCSICGSDLHLYHLGGITGDPFPIGHEAIGEVIEIGRDVRKVKPGDKVILPASTGCGACRFCQEGIVNNCERYHQQRTYGLGQALGGCQSEKILVPHGDFNVVLIPEKVTPEQALMLTDNLPTAYLGCVNADVKPGKNVVVLGLGPIGLLAVECAFLMGASRVFALDLVPERREMAAKLGAIAVDSSVVKDMIEDATAGRMADCVIECAGSNDLLDLAFSLVCRYGTISAVAFGSFEYNFPLMLAFMKALTIKIAICSVQQFMPELVSFLQSGRLHPERVFTHRMKLSAGAEAYKFCDKRMQEVLKIILEP